MKKKRTAAQFFDDAETNDLESLIKININSDKISKHLESGTEINYNRMLILWNEWVFMSFSITTKHYRILTNCILSWWTRYERRNADVSSHDIKTAKHFIESVVRDCSVDKKKSSMYIMLQKWTDFDVDWKRRPDNEKISSDVSKSIYFVRIQSFDLFFLLIRNVWWSYQYIQI